MPQINDDRYAFFVNAGIAAQQLDDMEVAWLLRELVLPEGQLNDLRLTYINTIGPLPYLESAA